MTKEKKPIQSNESVSKDIPTLFQVSQKFIFYRADEKKYLIVKDSDTESDFAQACGPWELPGGRISTGETAEDSFNREIAEELGSDISFSIIGPVSRAIIALPTRQIFRVGILAEYHSGDIAISEENSEFHWMTAADIAKDDALGDWLKEFIVAADNRLKERAYL
ncbi:MAG: NUDIX domain-containing protein, partial [Candidatus Moranbacteria bacterium]|nr:NUDIX domain-containing protein [Candidatus Moranbacteria bacterium]